MCRDVGMVVARPSSAARLNKFRRDAAVLAVYLAQFDNAEADPTNPYTSATALTPEGHQQCRRDYLQSSAWVTATEISGDDIMALTQMRQRYGFRPTS